MCQTLLWDINTLVANFVCGSSKKHTKDSRSYHRDKITVCGSFCKTNVEFSSIQFVAVELLSKGLPPQMFPANVNEKAAWSGTALLLKAAVDRDKDCAFSQWSRISLNTAEWLTQHDNSVNSLAGFSLPSNRYIHIHRHTSIRLTVNDTVNAFQHEYGKNMDLTCQFCSFVLTCGVLMRKRDDQWARKMADRLTAFH